MTIRIPTHSAWVVAQRAARLKHAGPEFERRQEGMQMDIGKSPTTLSLAETAVASGTDGDSNAFGAAMEELTVAVRDKEPCGQR